MSDTSGSAEFIEQLSAKKRALFEMLLEERRRAHSASTPQVIVRRKGATSYPLSFAQQRQWFLYQLDPHGAAFNVHIAERLIGRLNVAALERSLGEIVRRHDTLRTVFTAANDQPEQVIVANCQWTVAVVDLRQAAESERLSIAHRLATEQANLPFDLTKGPLFRATLLRLREQDHVLLLTTHHIVSDGWSMDVLLRELAVLYDAFATGMPSPLPELPIQYGDFAQWQREWLTGDVLEGLVSYWKKQIAKPIPVLQMPIDWQRPPVQSMQGANKSLKLSRETSESLTAFCRREGVTLFMLMLAILDTLLHRYSGEPDIVVGTPIANRNRLETQGLIGVFINMIALRVDNSGHPTFRELLRRVRDLTVDAYAHEDLPFEKLVEELQPERDPGRHPIFQVMLVQQNASDESMDLPGLKVSPLAVETGTSQLDLTLFFLESAEGLLLSVDYDTALFRSDTIDRLLGHFRVLAAAIIKNPERRLHDLSLLTEEEKYQLLVLWNRTEAAYPADLCLHQLFEFQVESHPQALAVRLDDECLTYGELNTRANQLARCLRKLGVGPDSLIGICVERSVEMVVGILGVLKAGGAYVPLEPGYPKPRLALMLEDANPPVLLTQQKLLDRIPPHKAAVICLDAQSETIAREDGKNLDNLSDPGNLAYVIYTSGSTGAPKGVLVTHGNAVNSTVARFRYYGDTLAGFLLLSSYAFDSSVAGIFWTLLKGATLTIPREGLHQDFFYIADLLLRHGPTHMLCLPSVHELLLKQKDARGLAALRAVIVAGEACPKELVELHSRLLPLTSLFNEYGPTEGSVWSSVYKCEAQELGARVPIGSPISNVQTYLLDDQMNPAPIGVPGHLHIGGTGLARGYLHRPDLTAEKFIPNPFEQQPGARLYKTGDVARYRPDGNIEFLGRSDSQVKIRGYRIELAEIEATLTQHPGVREAAVALSEGASDQRSLMGFVVAEPEAVLVISELRDYLRDRVPHYMIPSTITLVAELPLSPNGKLDRRALLETFGRRPEPEKDYQPPLTRAERIIAGVWQQALGIDKAGVNDNFFDLGGHSLLLAEVHSKLRDSLASNLTLIDLLRYPTISSLARYASHDESKPADLAEAATRVAPGESLEKQDSSIAIIGMAARFPGAGNIETFWANLRDGVESITPMSDEELKSSGVDDEVLRQPNYVKAGATLDDVDLFDASFFGFNPREAQVTDPQHRLFMECAFQALSDAACRTDNDDQVIGLYAGAGTPTYWRNLFSNPDFKESATTLQTKIGNEKDHLTTRVSYKLNLRGPSVAVQTTCSTSLVAVHMACRALLNGECTIALAGGVSISIPQKEGYFYEEGGINSPDGHCRAFDSKAQGTVAGNGVGVVVLKRLTDALAEGDNIRAVIRGSAINNDGSLKVGYTAPSIDGQAEVIARAQAVAGIDPHRVSYIEGHGTGTALGDPVEIAALTKVFRARTDDRGFCAIGSVKTNVGHLDTAAGVAGLIKVVLALNHKMLPPSLHYEQQNPQIDFDTSPFYVNAKLSEWNGPEPRLAGVSSFGIGGTNAHVLVEEAPRQQDSTGGRAKQLLILSAKSKPALEEMTTNLAVHLNQHADADLEDVAYTLQAGRPAFDHRRMLVCDGLDDAIANLTTLNRKRVFTSYQERNDPPIVFMFPGQGAQHVNMGLDLYRGEPAFRENVDRCSDLIKPHLGIDLREILYPSEADISDANKSLNQTQITQPAIFVVEYALAKLWMDWGVRPTAMVGHSIGEYVAACLAGVFSVEDALGLIATRARLMQELPPGAMLSVALPGERTQSLLDEKLSLAAVNGPSSTVVSGPTEAIEELEARLRSQDVECRRLRTSHAFHSAMMAPIAGALTAEVRKLGLNPPRLRYMSNVSGTWAAPDDSTDPKYWGKHLCQTVRFGEAVNELLKTPGSIFLEVGPGQTLSALLRRHPKRDPGHAVFASMRHPEQSQSDIETLLETLGQIWLRGTEPNWLKFNSIGRRRKVALPAYPFERKRYWVEAHKPNRRVDDRDIEARRKSELETWFYLPFWKPTLAPAIRDSGGSPDESPTWLIFVDETGLGESIAKRVLKRGIDAVVVRAGERFEVLNEREFTIDSGCRADYGLLLGEIRARAKSPEVIAHFWNVTADTRQSPSSETSARALDLSFYSLMFLAQEIGEHFADAKIKLTVVSSNMQAVSGDEIVSPEKATVLGPCKVIPKEFANLSCRSIDVAFSQRPGSQLDKLVDDLVAELTMNPSDPVVAYRGNRRLVPAFEQVELNPCRTPPGRLKEGGVYLITGGMGGVGLEVAKYLARAVRAKLVLIGRSAFAGADGTRMAGDGDGDRDKIAAHLSKVQELESLGAEVLYLSADVTNQDQMRESLERARKRFGPINGAVHSAGIPGGGITLAKTREMADSVLAPKIEGTRTLAKLLGDEKLDFLVLCSSLTSILGGIGQIDYCAANAYLDAFAYHNTVENGTFTVAVNWETWLEVGMAARASAELSRGGKRLALNPGESPNPTDRALEILGKSQTQGILPGQGTEIFSRIVSGNVSPQIVVCSANLQKLLQAAERISPSEIIDALESDGASDLRFPRPNIRTPYAAPRNQTERAIAELWQQVLGISEIGIHDDFFELGGDSLLAIQIISRVRQNFSVEPRMRDMFDASTVASFAEMIDQAETSCAKLGAPAIAPVSREIYRTNMSSQERFGLPEALKRKTQ